MNGETNFYNHQPCFMKVGNDYVPVPELMTEAELIQFLRIPEISRSTDHHNVIANLKRFRDLPRLEICNKVLFPKQAILQWVRAQTTKTGK